jgi:twitching motility protein PilU
MVNITQLLQMMVQKEASDLFFTAGARISMKIDGTLRPISLPELTPETSKQLAYALLTEEQIRQFEATNEMNLGYGIPNLGRFRVNIFRQRGSVAMVIRRLPSVIPSVEELGLPAVLERLAREHRGLVLVVGATGSGKTTTMAAMIDHRNSCMGGHILTVEDPIECVFKHKKSIVNQREVGADTLSYDNALVNALREAPDMIMIGEIRTRETMEQVINYANTGHLCLSTLHAINSHQALTRVLNFFPLETRATVMFDLASSLLAIVAQRLVRTKEGHRIPAVEVFIADYHIRQLIREGRLDEIQDVIEKGITDDMQSFDQAVVKLYKAGKISYEEAQANADSPRQLHLLIHSAAGDALLPQDSTRPAGRGEDSAASLPDIEFPSLQELAGTNAGDVQ